MDEYRGHLTLLHMGDEGGEREVDMKLASSYITDKMVCMAYAVVEKQRGPDWDTDYEWPYVVLARATNLPETVCFRAMERCASKGLIEYGVSLRTGWLTEAGRELVDLT